MAQKANNDNFLNPNIVQKDSKLKSEMERKDTAYLRTLT